MEEQGFQQANSNSDLLVNAWLLKVYKGYIRIGILNSHIIPINQVASVSAPLWPPTIVIETTGGKKFEVPFAGLRKREIISTISRLHGGGKE